MNDFLTGSAALFATAAILEKIHWFSDCGKYHIRNFTVCVFG